MRKSLIYTILTIASLLGACNQGAFAQWVSGGTTQGITSSNKQIRWNFGASGFIYGYTKGQVDSIIAATAGVTSFNSRTGAVIPLVGDYSAFYGSLSQQNTNTSNIALRELLSNKTSTPSNSTTTYPNWLAIYPRTHIDSVVAGYIPIALINGITKSYYDPTSSIQGQFNSKQPTITIGYTSQYFRGDLSLATLNTANVPELTNLYYTDARARVAHSFTAGSGAYNSTTGVITIPTNNNQITNGAGYLTTETDPTVPAYAKSLTAFSVIKPSTDALYGGLATNNVWGGGGITNTFNSSVQINSSTSVNGAFLASQTAGALFASLNVSSGAILLQNTDGIIDHNPFPTTTPLGIYGYTYNASGNRLSTVTASALSNFLNLSTGYVPYSGANSNVNLGGYNLTANIVTSTTDALIDSITVGRGPGNFNSNTVIALGGLKHNIGGTGNIAGGYHSLWYNDYGVYNLAGGPYALGGNRGGSRNMGLMPKALISNKIGSDQTAAGYNVGYLISTALYSITVNNGGSGYVGAKIIIPSPTDSLLEGTGLYPPARATAIVSGGVITGAIITYNGTQYTSVPPISVVDTLGSGSGAVLTAVLKTGTRNSLYGSGVAYNCIFCTEVAAMGMGALGAATDVTAVSINGAYNSAHLLTGGYVDESGWSGLFNATTANHISGHGRRNLYDLIDGYSLVADGDLAGDNLSVPLQHIHNGVFIGTSAIATVDNIFDFGAIGDNAQVGLSHQMVYGSSTVTSQYMNGALTLTNIPAYGSTPSVFLTSNAGVISSITPAQTLTGIGAAPSTGSANYIQNQSTSAQASSSLWTNGVIRGGGNLEIGNALSFANGTLFSMTTDGSNDISQVRASTNATAATHYMYKARGTNATPLIVASGDNVRSDGARAYDGAAYQNVGLMSFQVDGTPSAGSIPGRWIVSTVKTGTGVTEGIRLDANQNFGVGTGAASVTTAARIHSLSTTEQLRLGNDATHYSSFTTNSAGNLTISPSGTTTNITGSLNISGLTASLPVFTDGIKNLTNIGPGTSSQYIKGDGTLGTTPLGTVTGTGTTNKLAVWTSSTAIGNSIITDNGTGLGVSTTALGKFNTKGPSAAPVAATANGSWIMESSDGSTSMQMGIYPGSGGTWVQTYNQAISAGGTFPYSVNPNGGALNLGSTSSAVNVISLTTAGIVTNTSGGLLGTVATVPGANGGTGVANTGKTITLGGNLTTSGANAVTFTTTGATNVTLPTSGTLGTTAYTDAAISALSATSALFTSKGTTTLTNTTTETSLIPTGVGTMTAPTPISLGTQYRLTIGGIYSTPAVTAGTLTIKIKYNGTTLATGVASGLLAGASGLAFDGAVKIATATSGSSGSMYISGGVNYSVANNAARFTLDLNNGGSPITVNNLNGGLIEVTGTWDTASASKVVTITQFTLEQLK